MTTDLKSKTVEELLEDIDADWNTGPLKAGKEIALRLEEAQQRIADLEKAHELVAMAFENRIEKHLATVAELEEAQERIAERDAALARCVEALGTIELEASIFRVDPPMSEDELMAKFEAISELAGNTLESLPSSAKATAKALAAARWVPCDEQMPDLVGRDDSHVPGGAPATLYSERVLVFDGTVRIDNLIQAEGIPETRTFYVGSRKPVTHWMPLPEPPEAIREEQAQK